MAKTTYRADYRKEFPDFDPATMPAIPATWVDTSWRNDSCPGFRTMTGLTVFVDFADNALREWPEGQRFSISLDPEMHDGNDPLCGFDKWEDALAYVLADRFAFLIREYFTEEQYAETKRRNRLYGAEVCATHDFCDANIIMAAAFKDVFGREVDTDCDADMEFWNHAWREAQKLWLS
jgi:hypothetical protein